MVYFLSEIINFNEHNYWKNHGKTLALVFWSFIVYFIFFKSTSCDVYCLLKIICLFAMKLKNIEAPLPENLL